MILHLCFKNVAHIMWYNRLDIWKLLHSIIFYKFNFWKVYIKLYIYFPCSMWKWRKSKATEYFLVHFEISLRVVQCLMFNALLQGRKRSMSIGICYFLHESLANPLLYFNCRSVLSSLLHSLAFDYIIFRSLYCKV